MTPGRLKTIMGLLGWDDIGLAMVLGLRRETSVRHWLSGRRAVPDAVSGWLEEVWAWHHANPPPVAPGAGGEE